jgi:hypothetical protein
MNIEAIRKNCKSPLLQLMCFDCAAPKDLLALCDEVERLRGMLDEAVENSIHSDGHLYECSFCNAYGMTGEKMEHDSDCLVVRVHNMHGDA